MSKILVFLTRLPLIVTFVVCISYKVYGEEENTESILQQIADTVLITPGVRGWEEQFPSQKSTNSPGNWGPI